MKTEIQGSALTVRLNGELDHHSALELKDKLDNLYDRSGCLHIIFDFSQVTFMDSSGIGMIIGRYKNVEKRGGRVAITQMNQQLERIYNMSGLQKIVSRYPSVSDAGQALEMGGPGGGN